MIYINSNYVCNKLYNLIFIIILLPKSCNHKFVSFCSDDGRISVKTLALLFSQPTGWNSACCIMFLHVSIHDTLYNTNVTHTLFYWPLYAYVLSLLAQNSSHFNNRSRSRRLLIENTALRCGVGPSAMSFVWITRKATHSWHYIEEKPCLLVGVGHSIL